jgi:hypothetical protein
MTPPQRSGRTALRLVLVVAVSGSLLAGATAARGSSTNIYTLNRPSTVELGGATYLGWADTSGFGQVNVTKLNSNGTQGPVWTEQSSTYNGTGPTIAGSNGGLVVAWADSGGGVCIGSGGCVHLALTTGGSGGGFQCETYVSEDGQWAQAVATPYLTSEGDDGTGRLFLTWVDYLNQMHVDTVTVPKPGPGCQFSLTTDLVDFSDTSWDGPAMVVSGYGTGTEDYWLMWAGTDSAHHLNIAEYNSNWARIAENTETSHATLTDMGAAYRTSTQSIWMSYCGTNNDVYYQIFNGVSGGVETRAAGSCVVDLYNGVYSGGGRDQLPIHHAADAAVMGRQDQSPGAAQQPDITQPP